jgi:hypothetical protein
MGRAAPSVQFDRNKFREAVLLICALCEPGRLGAVKLHKVLYFADMLWYVLTGHPLTGATYRKRPYGPTADQLLSALRQLERDGALQVRDSNYYGFRKIEYIPLQGPNLTIFNEREISLIRDMADFVANHNTAKTISDLSHNHAWELAEFGEELPYYTALALFPAEPSEEAITWAASMVGQIETERPKRSSLDYETFGDFRSRVLSAREDASEDMGSS